MDIEILPLPAIICNSLGKIIDANSIFKKITGYQEIKDKSLLSITLPKYKQQTYNVLKNNIKELKTKISTEIFDINQQIIYAQLNIKNIDDNLRLILLCDISEFKKTEEQLLNTIIASEEKERRRIATELHDNLSPILSAIKLYIDLLKKNIPANNQDQIKNIDDLISLAITTAKEISYNITPSILHDFGLAEAIKKFAEFINKSKKLQISVKADQYTLSQRLVAESILYHAAKELINNTLKHSMATHANIELRNTSSKIILYYRDNGKGFNVQKTIEKGHGLGLRNLINKVQSLNGLCDFYSQPQQGFIALITIPIPKNNSNV